MFIQTQLSARA